MTKEQEEKIVKIVKNMSDEEIEDRIRQDEQEEAIEIIEKMVKSYIEADECGLSNNDFKHEIKAMQTVLSMLKEKDKEIEHLEDKRNNQKTELAILNEKQKEMNKLINTVSSYKGMVKKLKKENMIKDKEIDLMAEELVKAHEYFYSEFDNFSKEDFIGYFERKATNNG